jgi:hypothetical protein
MVFHMSEAELIGSPLVLQDSWRAKLSAAEHAYHDAAADLQILLQEHTSLAATPDLIPGLREARERKAAARAEYCRILRIFTDLVLRGKAPSA